MRDDDRPPLPPTCRTGEPWVNPWTTEPQARKRPTRVLVAQIVTLGLLLATLALTLASLGITLYQRTHVPEPVAPVVTINGEQLHCTPPNAAGVVYCSDVSTV